jgi:class 3 adenylate cyclase
VLDAVGSERAVILGISAGGPTAALFAASHPKRTRALIIYGGYARMLAGDGYEFGLDRDTIESFISEMQANWGSSFGISLFAPSRADDPAACEYLARYATLSASPGAAATFLRALAVIDVRHALPTITAPTLFLHASRDRNVPIEAARYNKELIPGAALVELDSDVHLIWLSDVVDDITNEIENFIARTVPTSTVERALATVMAVTLPDRARHFAAMIDVVVERCGGNPLREPGVATFDGPARAIRCALALISEIGTDAQQVGVAVHSGECRLGNEGLHGVAVDMTRQLAAAAQPGQVLVSQTIRDLIVGSAIRLAPHGKCSFNGIPGDWDVFNVLNTDA